MQADLCNLLRTAQIKVNSVNVRCANLCGRDEMRRVVAGGLAATADRSPGSKWRGTLRPSEAPCMRGFTAFSIGVYVKSAPFSRHNIRHARSDWSTSGAAMHTEARREHRARAPRRRRKSCRPAEASSRALLMLFAAPNPSPA